MAWTTIEDLPDDHTDLTSPELASLKDVWLSQKSEIERRASYGDFSRRFSREWAIETGLIEGLYSLDRGITQTLIEQGFDAALIPHAQTNGRGAAQIIQLLRDQERSLEGLFDFIRQERELSVGYIKELHALLTRTQQTTEAVDQFGRLVETPLIRGEWKVLPNNPTRTDGQIHEYCPPVQVQSQMEYLVERHREHFLAAVPAEIQAAWLHHRFTQVHPFQDGNGRVARALASLVLIRAGLFPFHVDRSEREKYIGSLEAADAGDLGLLVQIIVSSQSKSLRRAMSIAEDVNRAGDRNEAIIGAAIRRLRDRFQNQTAQQSRVFETLDQLTAELTSKLSRLRTTIEGQVGNLPISVFEGSSTGETQHYFNWDVQEVGRENGYFANWRKFHRWRLLGIKQDFGPGESSSFMLIFSAHASGTQFSGGLAVAAFGRWREQFREPTAEKPAAPLTETVFSLYYNERPEHVLRRFSPWVDEAIQNGLAVWQRTI